METAAVAESGKAMLNSELFTVAGTPVSITTLIMVLLVLLVAWLISTLLRGAVIKAMKARDVGDTTTEVLVRRLVHYFVMAVGFAVALDTVGVSLSALFAAGAVFAVGIGFAMQNIVQNFMSGVILLVERTIHPGDILLLEGDMVEVREMGIRTTIVRNRDEIEVIVPNTTLAQNAIHKLTGTDNLLRVRCSVGVAYGCDMRKVKQVLQDTANAFPGRTEVPTPQVQMTGFGANSVDWVVQVWTDDPWRSAGVISDLHEAVWFALLEAGISIAYPQVDVHLDKPVVELLRNRAS
jgi:potassium-dependent mechanosensitive channel